MIGKRKRDTSVVPRSTTVDEEEPTPTTADSSAHDVFRRYFEAQFQPLELPGGPVPREAEIEEDEDEDDESEESDSGSEWGGVSEPEDGDNNVEVVEHDSSNNSADIMDKKARKAFMTAKLPDFSLDSTTKRNTIPKDKDQDADDETEADNLKNDLALQRLLKESHLLESASELAPTGKNRHKALDLRMQSLGSKTSIYKQNMPSSIRRGIQSKATQKEDKRRREARENGIILEKPAPKAKSNSRHRMRGVGGPSVGKFSGGTLNLNKRDIAALQGHGGSARGKPKGRR